MNVKLTNVKNDQEDFADLIGNTGKLIKTTGDGYCFMPNNRGDFLSMHHKDYKETKDYITIETKLDNTFTFKIVPDKLDLLVK